MKTLMEEWLIKGQKADVLFTTGLNSSSQISKVLCSFFASFCSSFGAFLLEQNELMANSSSYVKGPQHLMYLMVDYAGVSLCIYLVMLSYLKFGKLKKRQEEQETKSAELDHLN